MRIILLLGILFTLTPSGAFSCDCGYNGSFLKMSKSTPLVSLVKVKKYLTFKDIYSVKTPMSMEVELIDTYRGKEARKTIIVWGDIGNLCRPYLSTFKEGEYYVMAFDTGGGGHPNEKNTDYSISGCGCYWLSVDFKNENAIGDINSSDRTTSTISLKNLKEEVRKKVNEE